MGGGGRDLDITIYGATGFVGRLAARYLSRVGAGLRIALAGRDEARLRAVRDALGPRAAGWPVRTAPLTEPDALRALAGGTRVLVSTVGPCSRHGLPLAAACAETGTDYADLTGEVPFVRACADAHHERAAAGGTRIVHSCGFDSVPSDLTVWALHRRAAADGAGELGDTTMVLRAYSGGYAGGSIATMLELMRLAAADPQVRRRLDDPYSLSPDPAAEPDLGPQPDLPLCPGAAVAPELDGLWLGGYLMALYNTRCVRRSNALLGWRYGRRFRYREALTMGSGPLAPMIAAAYNAGLAGAAHHGGDLLRLVPPGLLERMLPAPGTGYDAGMRGHYRVETYTTTTSGRRYVAAMVQQGDPGYTATAVLLGECALALARDRDRLPRRAGVLTPAVAFGDVLPARLADAGVRLEVRELS
ncbi:trans-acting enoyl reductase family protein [uncultured Mycolicibacterium sp.]|uniref:saccharopine dehydrogenase family protein n=1 Tax=uncultured Mycolicibacterium sp. TaxID=2320817 RepID=UPI0026080D3B|nr:saccharopine dehydrogenase NADP-binding domain-containing protein [uncultured Mycolicibacterium sp.]